MVFLGSVSTFLICHIRPWMHSHFMTANLHSDGFRIPEVGAVQTYNFAKYFQKLDEIGRIWNGGVYIQNFTM